MAKKVTKKSPKKVTSKKAPARKKTTKKGSKRSNGLNGSQVKVLQALRPGKAMNRTQLNKQTGISKGWSKLLGAGTRDGLGVAGDASLAGMGLITIDQYEGERTLSYTITAEGRKALGDSSK